MTVALMVVWIMSSRTPEEVFTKWRSYMFKKHGSLESKRNIEISLTEVKDEKSILFLTEELEGVEGLLEVRVGHGFLVVASGYFSFRQSPGD
jgi:hypothetical protein